MKNLAQTLSNFEDGRWKNIIEAIGVKDCCGECNYFNLSINDPSKGYRCYCSPFCIAATLNKEIIELMNEKLGWIKNDIFQPGKEYYIDISECN